MFTQWIVTRILCQNVFAIYFLFIHTVVDIVNYAADFLVVDFKSAMPGEKWHVFETESTWIPGQVAETWISPLSKGLIRTKKRSETRVYILKFASKMCKGEDFLIFFLVEKSDKWTLNCYFFFLLFFISFYFFILAVVTALRCYMWFTLKPRTIALNITHLLTIVEIYDRVEIQKIF